MSGSSQMVGVRLEVTAGLSHYFGGEGPGRVVLEKEVRDGATVGDLLEEITSRKQELRELLFDVQTGRLSGYIGLILNGRFLELAGGLETKLQEGDNMRLMLAIRGG